MHGSWVHHEKTGGGKQIYSLTYYPDISSDPLQNLNIQVGYKELCIHMASDHGGLEEVMAKDEREEIRDLIEKIRRR